MSKPLRLAVLVSGSGTTLQNLIDQISNRSLHARIVQVIASKAGIKGIDRARAASLPCQIVRGADYPGLAAFSSAVFDCCREADLVCLGGWLSLLEIPESFRGRVMNIHPSLLPDFGGKGMYGHFVHEAVLRSGKRESGCTVHLVNNQYDAGPILLQRRCPVLPGDTPHTLAARVFEVEKAAYPEAIRQFVRQTFREG